MRGAARSAFGADTAVRLPDTGLRGPSRFTFKLHDVAHALDQIADFGRTIVPGPIGRRLVVRDARERLEQMTDRHAGRLRSQLVERTWDAVLAYERELGALVDETVAAIDAVVERALGDRDRGERDAHQRLDELAALEARFGQLAHELDADAHEGIGDR